MPSGEWNCKCFANAFQWATNRGRAAVYKIPAPENPAPEESQLGREYDPLLEQPRIILEKLEVSHPECAVTGLIFMAPDRNYFGVNPQFFRPRGLITRREEAEPVESSELGGNAVLYDCL